MIIMSLREGQNSHQPSVWSSSPLLWLVGRCGASHLRLFTVLKKS